MVFELGGVWDRFAVFAHGGQGAGEQVCVALFAEAKDHRGAHIEAVAVALETAATAAGDQVALQHQHPRPLTGQLAGGYEATDAGADHHHVVAGGARGCAQGRVAVAAKTLGIPATHQLLHGHGHQLHLGFNAELAAYFFYVGTHGFVAEP